MPLVSFTLQSSNQILADFVDEAKRIVNEAERQGIFLRLMGATAIMLHCPKYRRLYEGFQRKLTDLDFATYGKFRGKLPEFFTRLGYKPEKRASMYFGERRHIYMDEGNHRIVDVFFDKLEFSHTLNLAGRLELDGPTITLSDILFEKMQIARINEKDIKDTIIMLREHEISSHEKDALDEKYVAKLLSRDWGFYYTVTVNLQKVKDFLGEFAVLSEEDRKDVGSKVDRLIGAIEKEPKSMSWRARAKVGTRKKWYADVEEVVR